MTRKTTIAPTDKNCKNWGLIDALDVGRVGAEVALERDRSHQNGEKEEQIHTIESQIYGSMTERQALGLLRVILR